MPIEPVEPNNVIDRHEFHRRLLRWLALDPAEQMIGHWISPIADGENTYYLNSDSTREGVTGYLTLVLRDGIGLEWQIPDMQIPDTQNAKGIRVVFGPNAECVDAFYFYRRWRTLRSGKLQAPDR